MDYSYTCYHDYDIAALNQKPNLSAADMKAGIVTKHENVAAACLYFSYFTRCNTPLVVYVSLCLFYLLAFGRLYWLYCHDVDSD